MPRRSPSADRRSEHRPPGRNLSARAKAVRNSDAARNREQEKIEPVKQRPRKREGEVGRPAAPPARVRCPRGKTGFSEAAANHRLEAHRNSTRPNRPVRVYKCEHCGAFHLTSWSSPPKSASA